MRYFCPGWIALAATVALTAICLPGATAAPILPQADPVPPPVPPLTAAIAKLTADATAYQSTSGSIATIQAAIAVAQAQLVALQATAGTLATAIIADQATIAGLVNVPTPTPTPTPTPVPPTPIPTPPTGVVSFLVLTDPSTCPPCAKLAPVLTALAKTGVPVTTMSVSDPAASKYAATAEPTTILLVDSVEPPNNKAATRFVGYGDQPLFVDWYSRNVVIFKKNSTAPKLQDFLNPFK
jgi:thiol-disulfide isomerase/thioredoxin